MVDLEKRLFDGSVRLSIKALDLLLADDFKEITSTGRTYFKDEALSRLPQESPPQIKADNFELSELNSNLVLLNYRSILIRSVNNRRSAPIFSLRTSIWQFQTLANQQTQWQMLFHQGTPCAPFQIDN
ncbi:MAG: nuclear transport factor 2 family protein [Kangiellaceae bacterium]|nr:nuclear transport factor 2 family protein [Kangiellaceae bacterium]MCW9018245.1 nuclear transport factor 2 family protein [Kangiellaceae bacterium]